MQTVTSDLGPPVPPDRVDTSCLPQHVPVFCFYRGRPGLLVIFASQTRRFYYVLPRGAQTAMVSPIAAIIPESTHVDCPDEVDLRWPRPGATLTFKEQE